MDLFDYSIDFHKNIKRKGPGNDEQSKKALDYIPQLPDGAKAMDIGCATGTQTMFLVNNTKVHITSIDIVPVFLEELKKKVRENQLSKRVTVRLQSMDKLDYQDNTFDLFWSENSIHHIGFERGLREWYRYIKPDGYIVVSDLSWLTEERPKDLENYWYSAAKGIDTIKNKVAVMKALGYQLLGNFVLPDECWLNDYYYEMEEHADVFLQKHNVNKIAKLCVEDILSEIDMFKKFSKYYGVVFFIARVDKKD